MKRLLMMVLVLAAGEASAIERYNIAQMSCEQVKAKLRAAGTAVLRFPSRAGGPPRYGVFVPDRVSCRAPQIGVKARVKAEDGICIVYQCTDVGSSQRR